MPCLLMVLFVIFSQMKPVFSHRKSKIHL
uniref:Uncharacterized protein n=1 Tax=Rhizophora mucronata TaxID=61149 RepID=A0A2P2QD88_RHIMU